MQHVPRAAALLVVAAAVAGAAACSPDTRMPTEPAGVASMPLAAKTSVDKFTFTNVTFPDDTQGNIAAGSKHNNKGDVTVCDYYTVGFQDYLGQFQSDAFSSSNPDDVLAFCLAHYAERQ